jgi:putative heme-binding domain-containing protein
MTKANWASRSKTLTLMLCFILAWLLPAQLARPEGAVLQSDEVENPLAGNSEAIKQGKIFFNRDCSPCHGIEARGGRGPDLISGRSTHREGDATLFKIISKGLPGTEMPGGSYKDDEVWMIIAFLRSLATIENAISRDQLVGDPHAGEKLFVEMCSQCHQVNRRGGRLGPDLSRIGAARSISYLTESIRHAGNDVPRKYETVVAFTKEGKRIAGIRLNEDTFSLQLMDQHEDFHSWLKKDLKEVIYERRSLMPDYNEQILNEKALQDLLAYLASLRGKRP